MYVVLIMWSSIGLFGLLWLVMTALKTNKELFANVWALPAAPQWENFARAWTRSKMGNYFVNSVLAVGITVPIIAVIGSMAAYVLARCRFFASRAVLLFFVAGSSIPLQLITVPLFLFFNRIGLLNSLWGLMVVYVAINMPFTVFVLTGFYRSLPVELEEAALIDGASSHGVFWKVAFPLGSPGIATVSIFNALSVWNEYMLALMLISDRGKFTVPLGLYNLKVVQDYAADWVGLLAGLVIVLIPSIGIFLLLQRRIVRGLTVGALKG
jgi:N-acetylglucosamine transport system permease protein